MKDVKHWIACNRSRARVLVNGVHVKKTQMLKEKKDGLMESHQEFRHLFCQVYREFVCFCWSLCSSERFSGFRDAALKRKSVPLADEGDSSDSSSEGDDCDDDDYVLRSKPLPTKRQQALVETPEPQAKRTRTSSGSAAAAGGRPAAAVAGGASGSAPDRKGKAKAKRKKAATPRPALAPEIAAVLDARAKVSASI